MLGLCLSLVLLEAEVEGSDLTAVAMGVDDTEGCCCVGVDCIGSFLISAVSAARMASATISFFLLMMDDEVTLTAAAGAAANTDGCMWATAATTWLNWGIL